MAAAWNHLAPPLRPCEADLRVTQHHMEAYASSRTGPIRVLLLGVTPEIALLSWPTATQLLAVEHCPEMIRLVWPGDVPQHRRAVCGDWLSISQPNQSLDIVLGDGSFISLAFPDELEQLAGSLREMMMPEGLLIVRFFVLPAEPETPAQVFRDLLGGRISSFHVFKFRLAMSLQEDPRDGVRLGDVWDAWTDAEIDRAALPAGPGWSSEEIATIALYRAKDVKLFFADLPSIQEILERHGFEQERLSFPQYEMADRCPTGVYRCLPRPAR